MSMYPIRGPGADEQRECQEEFRQAFSLNLVRGRVVSLEIMITCLT